MLISVTPLPTVKVSAKITLEQIFDLAILAPEYLNRNIIASVNLALDSTLFKITVDFFFSLLIKSKNGIVASKSTGLG